MCPSCKRRLRPPATAAKPRRAEQPPAKKQPERKPEQQSAPQTAWKTTAWDAALAAIPTAPSIGDWSDAVVSPDPVRPRVLFDRSATLEVNRATVAGRLLLAIPQLIIYYLLAIALLVLAVISWFASLVTAHVPRGIHNVSTNVIRYQTRVLGYAFLLTDEYPPFSFDGADYPVRFVVGSHRLNRVAVLFRAVLVVPAYIVNSVILAGAAFAGVVLWIVVLVLGRVPVPLFDCWALIVRYSARYTAYFALATAAYPAGLVNEPTPQWDDDVVTTDGLAADVPQPPRISRESRAAVLVVAAVGVIAVILLRAVGPPGDGDSTATQLRQAHDRLVTHLDDRCGGSRGDCPKISPQAEATFRGRLFVDFATALDRLDTPSEVQAAKDRLARRTDDLARLFGQLGKTATSTAYVRLYDASRIEQLLAQWDQVYLQLENAIL
jgi:hypothetical protein